MKLSKKLNILIKKPLVKMMMKKSIEFLMLWPNETADISMNAKIKRKLIPVSFCSLRYNTEVFRLMEL